jgi:predicted HicB family RNase H-like nuclease
MNTINYKGYTGIISYSEEDETFYGKLDHINDLVTFEGQSAPKLRKAFCEAVDDYLAICKEKGIDPEKPFRGTFNVRVDPKIHRMAYLKALKKGLSLNKYIESAIRKDLLEA